jgi:hypothetical protein
MVGVSLHRMHIDLTPIWYQEVNLIGTLGHGIETWPIGTSEKKSTFEIAAQLIENQQLRPDKLITHSFLLSEYRDALLTARNKGHHRAIKVVFDFSKQPASVVPNVRAAARRRRRVLTTTHPSQPLTPDDVDAHAPTPEPAVPVTYAAPDTTDAGDDPKTIVVSRPAHTRFNVPSPPETQEDSSPDQRSIGSATQNSGADDQTDKTITVSTSKHARFDATTQYGSLPGFHQGLEDLGIMYGDEEDDTRKTPAVPPGYQAQHTEPEPTPPTNTDEGKDNMEAPFIAPDSIDTSKDNVEAPFIAPDSIDTSSDYAWMQFIESQDTGENMLEGLSTTSTTTTPVNTDESKTGDQLSAPINTRAHNDESKTITTSRAKRGRSKHKRVNHP